MDKTVPVGAAVSAVDFDVAMEVASHEARSARPTRADLVRRHD